MLRLRILSPLLLAVSGSAQVLLGGPGCDWQVGGSATLLVFTDAAGNGSIAIPIPADQGLRGVDIFTQLASLEPLAIQGFTFSAPLRLRPGH